jgi:hypothetical protein
MMKYKHFIITRFLQDFGRVKIDQSYIDKRIYLTNNFYFKSLKNQKNQNFESVLLIDPKFKRFDFSKLIMLKNSKVLYTNKHARDIFEDLNKEFNLNSFDYIITSRVDSDDCIVSSYSNVIQKVFLENKDDMLIDFDKVIFCSNEKTKAGMRSYQGRSMFLSTAFKPREYLKYNCYAKGHGQMKALFEKIVVLDKIGGCCICHDSNISNSIGRNLVDPKKINFKKTFGI